MSKIKIRLDTGADVAKFVATVSAFKEDIYLTNNVNYRVNAKSLMGVMYASSEWGGELYVDSDTDLYYALRDFQD